MRGEADRVKIERFMRALGSRVTGPGRVYLTGGGTAVLEGWREMTIDLDLKAAPEPKGFFEAIAELKDAVDLNVKMAVPDDFIPALPGWRDRSPFIASHGAVEFYHYDLYSQALAKIERGHARDLIDVAALIDRGRVERGELLRLFELIEPDLIRFPAIEPRVFRAAVLATCRPGDTVT